MAKTSCESMREVLAGYLYEELQAEPRAAVKAHARECRECARVLEELRRTRSGLDGWTLPGRETPAVTGPWVQDADKPQQTAEAPRRQARRRRMRPQRRTPLWWALAAVAGAAAAVVAIVVLWPSERADKGPVKVAGGKETPAGPAARIGGRVIAYGEPVRAGREMLRLELDGEGEVVLDRGARVVLAAARELRLDAGRIYCRPPARVKSEAGRPSYTVTTPAGSVRAYGTRFLVRQTRKDRTLVLVAEGRVKARAGDKEVELTSGQEVVLYRGHGPGPVRKGDVGRRMAFLKGRGVHYSMDFTYGPGGWSGRGVEGALEAPLRRRAEEQSAAQTSCPWYNEPICRISAGTRYRFRVKTSSGGQFVFMLYSTVRQENFSLSKRLRAGPDWQTFEGLVADLWRHPGTRPRTRLSAGDTVDQITLMLDTPGGRRPVLLIDDVELFEPEGDGP